MYHGLVALTFGEVETGWEAALQLSVLAFLSEWTRFLTRRQAGLTTASRAAFPVIPAVGVRVTGITSDLTRCDDIVHRAETGLLFGFVGDTARELRAGWNETWSNLKPTCLSLFAGFLAGRKAL